MPLQQYKGKIPNAGRARTFRQKVIASHPNSPSVEPLVLWLTQLY